VFKRSIAEYEERFTNLVELRSSVVVSAGRQLEAVDQVRRSQPTVAEVKQEATRLYDQCRHPGVSRNPLKGAIDLSTKAYNSELDKLSQQLELFPDRESRRALLERTIADVDSGNVHENYGQVNDEVNVESELKQAWHLDQMTLLNAREIVIDKVTDTLSRLASSLSTLERGLSVSSKHVHEAEALVSALIEEIEEAVNDTGVARASHSRLTNVPSGIVNNKEHELLQAELTEMLKRKQDMRSPDARPLILLDREDVLAELGSLHKRLQEAETSESNWSTRVSSKLSALTKGHASLISAIYANSPMNTSPPFSQSADLQALEKGVAQKVEHLRASVTNLEKQAQLSDRDRRQMTAFVEKWARS